jgi:hypothetical protein
MLLSNYFQSPRRGNGGLQTRQPFIKLVLINAAASRSLPRNLFFEALEARSRESNGNWLCVIQMRKT